MSVKRMEQQRRQDKAAIYKFVKNQNVLI
jgi:hypothetical protein